MFLGTANCVHTIGKKMSLFWDASKKITQWNESLSLSKQINYPIVVWKLAGINCVTLIYVNQIKSEIWILSLSLSVYFSDAKYHTHTGWLWLRVSILLYLVHHRKWSMYVSCAPGRATKWTTSASGHGSSRTRRPSRCPDGSCLEASVSHSPTTATPPPSTRHWLESHTVSFWAFMLQHTFSVVFMSIILPFQNVLIQIALHMQFYWESTYQKCCHHEWFSLNTVYFLIIDIYWHFSPLLVSKNLVNLVSGTMLTWSVLPWSAEPDHDIVGSGLCVGGFRGEGSIGPINFEVQIYKV